MHDNNHKLDSFLLFRHWGSFQSNVIEEINPFEFLSDFMTNMNETTVTKTVVLKLFGLKHLKPLILGDFYLIY